MTKVKLTSIFKKLPVKRVVNPICFSSNTFFIRQMSNCIFCKIISGDAQAEIFYEDEKIMVFKDIKPCSKFHCLAVPKEHIVNVNHLTKDHLQLVEYLITKSKDVLIEKGGNMDDIRLGFHLPPFNSISHLHLHVIWPTTEMSYLQRIIFKPNTWWFASVEQILEKIGNSSKL